MEMSFYDLSSCKSSVNSVQRISQCPKKTHKAKVFRIKRRGIFTAPIVSFFFHAYVMNFKPSSCLMYAGIKKTYWITCNVDRDVHQLPLDRKRYPSNFVVRPHDLNRLLANFQSSLQETTIIATERNSEPSDAASEFGGKAVESRSYIDSTKGRHELYSFQPNMEKNIMVQILVAENDSLLHTQLWIDPAEEFVQYAHSSNPVDVTFAVKELKAYFDGPQNSAFDEGASSNFDAILVLATMLISQLHEGNTGPSANEMPGQADTGEASGEQPERNRTSASEIPSNHTRIWSELSGSAAKNGGGSDGRRVPDERILKAGGQSRIERISTIQLSEATSSEGNIQTDGHGFSQRHPSNWVEANEDEDDDNKDGDELCVRSTHHSLKINSIMFPV
ncbi:uncharacterized protein LOC115694557 isoform X2 [Syzygium oleosum]|uniref:uncharacterized protein LOC115694557 isoform X2 n=1 Tax=Syzygium oleosum TaxID=219896 RepID=UPI0024BB9CD4|nr:uncharacterized protein LOC115694557 isoform X2 [Syzygium oleosum]XP_056168042.1 uncharacterized protein LOC115694557 isoform X2 [Syzygium oleosum]